MFKRKTNPSNGIVEVSESSMPGCSNKRQKGSRKAPLSLSFAVIVAMVMAAMYLFRVFSYVPRAIEEDNMMLLALSFFFILLFYAMFVRFLIALFRLPSGSRKAWATTVRMATSYILFSILGMFGVNVLSVNVDFGAFVIPSWVMSVVMLALIVYMFMRPIRDFFTPSYADKVGLGSWIMYFFWIDPFSGKKMVVK